MLAAVEFSLLVDGIVWHVEGGVFSTFGADNGGALKIALMCHRNIFFKFVINLLVCLDIRMNPVLGSCPDGLNTDFGGPRVL